jgi:nucleoside-diphosphate-sugar epimerase
MINDLGWRAKTSLDEGIKKTLDYCLKNNIFRN